ncbi:hypothetical protein E2C01_093926 [Portunus trituberculatus]|uniref:Uncharacterized protein n=1 Tax=Portunus trituberculatus TaxID=210409 RepID=A0A5B7JR53_PORTR|nr:hypothetical protein [Portunus trituberculatus]
MDVCRANVVREASFTHQYLSHLQELGDCIGAAVVQWNHECFGVRGGLQVHGFESCPRSECRLGFLTRGNGFLAVAIGVSVAVHITASHCQAGAITTTTHSLNPI